MKIFWIMLALLLPLRLCADNDGDSPSGKLHYTLYHDDGKDTHEVYISSKDHKDNPVKLCETEGRSLAVFISQDDFWIIVQDGAGSMGVHPRLFQRVKGASFKEMKDADIEGKATRLLLKQNGLPADFILSHQYFHVLNWSGDSKFVLFSMSGDGFNDQYFVTFSDWTAIYDLGNGQITFDLNKSNGGLVEKSARK